MRKNKEDNKYFRAFERKSPRGLSNANQRTYYLYIEEIPTKPKNN